MDKISIESTTPVYTLSTVSALSVISVHSIRQYIGKARALNKQETLNVVFSLLVFSQF